MKDLLLAVPLLALLLSPRRTGIAIDLSPRVLPDGRTGRRLRRRTPKPREDE